ncbi:MAG: ribosome maturation factor RimM [Lachnospiraceae bacterium]
MEDRLRVGVITSTHGVRGEVKVYPTTDDPERFLDLTRVYLVRNGHEIETEIQGVKFFKQVVILKFRGVESMNDAELYRNYEIWIDRKDGVALEENEYYIADLIGMEVCLEDGSHFGTLKDVMETGANDVYIVTTEDGKEVLLPAIEACVQSVSLEENRMIVHIMEGLLDG